MQILASMMGFIIFFAILGVGLALHGRKHGSITCHGEGTEINGETMSCGACQCNSRSAACPVADQLNTTPAVPLDIQS